MRRLMLAAAVMLSVAALEAQEVRTVLVNVPITQRQGVFQSTSWDVPTNATGVIRMRIDIADADYVDTANSLKLRFYWLDAQGVWRVSSTNNWQGGAVTDPELGVNPRPYTALRIEDYRGRSVKAEAEVPNRMRVGLTIDIGDDWP